MNGLVNLVLRDAHPHDHRAAARVLAAAFENSPVVCWAEPDTAARTAQLGPYFTAMLAHAATCGVVRLATADTRVVGVALWYPEAAAPFGLHLLPDDRVGDETPQSLRRLARLEQLLRVRRPTGPHHYLAYLGVAHAEQSRGIGTTLISKYHETLRGAGMPAYLEANDPRNRALYARLGYSCHGAAVTGHGGPPVYPMQWTPTDLP